MVQRAVFIVLVLLGVFGCSSKAPPEPSDPARITHSAYGIVEGLNQTGDSADFQPLLRATTEGDKIRVANRELAIVQVLVLEKRNGMSVIRSTRIQSLGDASSLAGGHLRATTLQPQLGVLAPALEIAGAVCVDGAAV